MNKKLYTALFTLISFVSITSFASEQKRTVAHNSLQTLIPGQCKKAIEIDGVQVHFHTPSAKSKFLVHLEATKKQEAAKRKHVFIYENQDEVWGNQEDED
ncbi:MAG: hypothetical protein P4L31_07935, partial [Candidatus Babeliales bacterium]|nr:hypothetical protein [Candidatus Babeliales bacterium]